MTDLVRNKKVLVIGMARSGIAAARLLSREGACVTITDIRTEAELKDRFGLLPAGTKTSLGGHRFEDLGEAELIVLSPGVPSSLPMLIHADDKGIPIWSEVELAYRFLRGPVIGVTGSNGKTTTTTLIGEFLTSNEIPNNVSGNIGLPLSEVALSSDDSNTVHVVELSSFQLERIVKFRCKIAVILNITPDHLDRYSGIQPYAEAKARILMNQKEEDHAVINADDPLVTEIGRRSRARLYRFSATNKNGEAWIEDGSLHIVTADGNTRLCSLEELSLKGAHNAENVLGASLAAYLAGSSLDSIRNALRSFQGVEHRLEYVATIEGIEFYNDSKATNVDAAIKGVNAFNSKIITIMGGLDKGTDFSPLKAVLEAKAKKVILLGRAREKMAQAFEGTLEIEMASTLEEAVEMAFSRAKSGEAVALIPACASFDMFENFEERGRLFKEAVHRVAAERERVAN